MRHNVPYSNVAAILIFVAAAMVWLAVDTASSNAQDAASGDATVGETQADATAAAPSKSLSQNRLPRGGQAHFAPKTPQNEPVPDGSGTGSKPAAAPKLPEPKGVKRLSPDYDVWIDPKEKAVLIDGQISLREGMLEMFACTRNTKEHESIVSANTKAYLVHAALLTLGAEPGRPVQFVPKYRPPTGTEIEVLVRWIDERGRERTARAQEWVKDFRTAKAMTHPFVFAGSSFWTDEETGKKYYQAEGGDFICVSNFGTAMLDIPVESSQANTELAFEAFTEHIPPLGAPVRLILKPNLKKQGAGSGERGAGSREQGAGSKEQEKTAPTASPKVERNGSP